MRAANLLVAILLTVTSSGQIFAYSSQAPGYSITPPAGWATEPVGEDTVRFYPPGQTLRFIVETAETGTSSLSDFEEASIQTLTMGLNSGELVSETDTTLDGKPARAVILKGQVADNNYVEMVTILCVNGGWGFRITAFDSNRSPDSYADDFQRFVSSFSFSPKVTFPFKDDFNAAFGDGEWYAVRGQTGALSLNDRTGYLLIPTAYGDLWAGYNNAKNLLLRPAPAGDFEITTSLDFSPAKYGQQAGLIIYQNDDQYVSLGRAYDGSAVVDFISESKDDLSSWPVPFDSPLTFLKIARRGVSYSGYLSKDGSSWQKVYSYQNTGITSPGIGLFAFQSLEGSPANARFDYFALSEPSLNQSPVAEFLYDPLQPLPGNSISFVSTSVDPDGDELKYAWYLDGSYQQQAGNLPYWTLDSAPGGKHTIELRVDDSNGGTAQYKVDLNLGGKGGGGSLAWIYIVLGVVVVLVIVGITARNRKAKN